MDGWDELGGADVTETPEVYDEMADSALEAIEPVEVPETMDMPEPVESSFEFSDAAPEMPEESYVDSVMDSVEPEALEFEDEIPEAEPQFEEMPIEEPQIDEPAIEEPQIEEQIEVFDPEPQPEMVSEVAEIEPEVMDVAPEVTEPAPEEAQIQEWAEGETVDPHEALNNMSEYMNAHNYGIHDYGTYSQDPEWQALNRDLQLANGMEVTGPVDNIEPLDDNFEIPEPQPEEIEQSYVDSVMDSVEPEDLDFEDEIPETPEVQEIPEEAQIEESDIEVFDPEPQPETVQEVMDEAPEEVQEPQEWTEGETIEIEHEEVPQEWSEGQEIQIEHDEIPQEVSEKLDPHEALDNMYEYMAAHNYGLDDYATYSQDPEWQALNRDLQQANGIEVESIEQAAETVEAMDALEAVEAVEPRVFDEFEQKVLEENPEFYETGQFYQQGINEFGYEGTCGPTSQANALNELLGSNNLTENKILEIARDNHLCCMEGEPGELGGTSTEQFMELYDKVNEQLGDKFDTELFEYGNALGAEQVAERLESGDVVNVAVDACSLWNQPREYVNEMGVRQDDFNSDHWITVTGVNRGDGGDIKGFEIIDSGGGESYVSLDKYNEMCFGTPEHKVLDPTCIVVSKKA